MKINLNKQFVDCFGKPVANAANNVAEAVCVALFNASTLNGAPMSPEEKYKAFKLSQRIAANPDGVVLDGADVNLIKAIVGASYSAGAYGCVCDLLENP